MRRRLVGLFGSFVLMLVGASLLFGVAEGHDFWGSLYWVCMTVSSVGYGDISPKTWVGQALAIFCGFIGGRFLLSDVRLIVPEHLLDRPSRLHA